jgi:hypothetical protein
MQASTRMEERLVEIGRRADRLHASTQSGTPEAKIGTQRRADALRKEEALTRTAVREAAAGIKEELGQLDTRVDTAGRSAAADVAQDTRMFVAAVEAELHTWDAYLERQQVKAATTAGRAREQAEAAISELRRRRNAVGERLREVRSASAEAGSEARKSLEVARDEFERTAAEVAAGLERGGKP